MSDILKPRQRSSGRSDRPMRRFARRFAQHRVGVVSAIFLVIIILVAVLAPLIAPADPDRQDLAGAYLGPLSDGHLLGTDNLGRDVLSRLIFGARVSLLAVVQAVTVGAVIGIVSGLLAGYLGGAVDWIVMRLTDSIMSFPPLLLALTVVAALGPSLTNAMIAVGIIFAPRFTRITRSSVLVVREETFIEAARAIGTPRGAILRRHVLPNVISPIIILASVLAGHAMVIEAGLSFVGLGAQPPQSSWGAMLADSFAFTSNAPLLSIWPGLLIAVTVLMFNLLGDGIRDSIGREVRRPT